jgi:fluoride ion exporter CrcB/FEX
MRKTIVVGILVLTVAMAAPAMAFEKGTIRLGAGTGFLGTGTGFSTTSIDFDSGKILFTQVAVFKPSMLLAAMEMFSLSRVDTITCSGNISPLISI